MSAPRRPLSRRALVSRLAAGAGLLALAAAGCRPAAPTPTRQPAPTPRPTEPARAATATQPTTSAPSPTAPAPLPTSRPPAPTPTPQPTALPEPALPTPRPAAPTSPAAPAKAGGTADLVVVRGPSPSELVRAAVEALGGIQRFVPKGSTVVVKPNICISSAPEYAATTNPEVVAALVKLCREAGAGRVKVLDYGFAGQSTSYVRSGIEAAVKEAGGEMVAITPIKWKMTPLPGAKAVKSVEVYEDVLKADVLINVPIAKHHNLARLTLGMKNLMGVVSYREQFHGAIGQSLSDLSTVVKPAFTLVDAVRILTRNGPTGGSLDWVKRLDTVVASTDVVAADAYASTLFGLKPDELESVRSGQASGLGSADLAKLRLAELRRG